jgi:hypothetical protein
MSECTKCGTKKENHYGEYCPLCDKPQVKVVYTLDLIKSFTHVSAKHYADDTSKYRNAGYLEVWSYLCNCGYIKNDTTTAIDFPELYDDIMCDPSDHRLKPPGLLYVEQLIEAFDLRSLHMKDIEWVVSW